MGEKPMDWGETQALQEGWKEEKKTALHDTKNILWTPTFPAFTA